MNQIGDELPELAAPPIGRLAIAYMAVAMRDPNPVHVEDDYAVRSGLPGVIAHGTFVTSYAGMLVSRAVGVSALRQMSVDLLAPVFPGDVLRAAGTVVAAEPHPHGRQLTVSVRVTKQDGTQVGRGTVVAVEPAPTVTAS